MNLWLDVEYVSKRRRKIRHALCVMCNQDQDSRRQPIASFIEGRDLSPSLLADVFVVRMLHWNSLSIPDAP